MTFLPFITHIRTVHQVEYFSTSLAIISNSQSLKLPLLPLWLVASVCYLIAQGGEYHPYIYTNLHMYLRLWQRRRLVLKHVHTCVQSRCARIQVCTQLDTEQGLNKSGFPAAWQLAGVLGLGLGSWVVFEGKVAFQEIWAAASWSSPLTFVWFICWTSPLHARYASVRCLD